MSETKTPKPDPKGRGYVVDHKEAGARMAVSPANFNDKEHEFVRNLAPGETVLGYRPRRKAKAKTDTATTGPVQATK